MTPTLDPSVEMLRRESEQNRAALAQTVRDLRSRVGETVDDIKTAVSPAHIKGEIKPYVREERENLLHSVERRIRDNPLQAAAIGAAIAYPALGMLRAIPVPLLMIGAGLWLTGASGKRAMAQAGDLARENAESLRGKVSDLAASGYDKAADLTTSVQQDFARRTEGLREDIASSGFAPGGVGSTVNQARSAAGDLRDAVNAKVADVADRVRGASNQLGETTASIGASARAGVQQASDTAARFAADARARTGAAMHSAGETIETSRRTVVDFVQENPLLVAGASVALGAFIAAALPKTSAENEIFGGMSENLKRQAKDAAAQGLDRAKTYAADVTQDAMNAATQQGLDPQSLASAVDHVVDGVKAVAERGVKTALEGKTSGARQSMPQSGGQQQSNFPNTRQGAE